MSERRIAITGMGLICGLGLDRQSSWLGLCEGRCGIRDLTLFDGAGYRSRMVAEVPAWDGARWFSPQQRRRYSRADQFAIVAASEALADSGLLATGIPRESIGVFFGVGTGDLLRNEVYFSELLAGGVRRAHPSKIVTYLNHGAADPVAQHFGLLGPRACLNTACSSSAMAIGHGADLIRSGRIQAAVCGGGEALCRMALSGFNALRVVDVEPCRPFDVSRNGMNLGEAGAVLVLEDMAHARARGAHVHAELAGWAAYCEAHHATAPEPDGLAVAALLEAALAASGVSADEVDHINAHGTGTPQNDRAEALGIRTCVRRPRIGHSGHEHQVDAGSLPRSGQRGRGDRAGADDRAWRDPADGPPHPDGPGVPGRRRRKPLSLARRPVRSLDVAGLRRQRRRHRHATGRLNVEVSSWRGLRAGERPRGAGLRAGEGGWSVRRADRLRMPGRPCV